MTCAASCVPWCILVLVCRCWRAWRHATELQIKLQSAEHQSSLTHADSASELRVQHLGPSECSRDVNTAYEDDMSVEDDGASGLTTCTLLRSLLFFSFLLCLLTIMTSHTPSRSRARKVDLSYDKGGYMYSYAHPCATFFCAWPGIHTDGGLPPPLLLLLPAAGYCRDSGAPAALGLAVERLADSAERPLHTAATTTATASRHEHEHEHETHRP